MKGVLRKALFAVPFGCFVALAVHGMRFGDDHAFGGRANEGIVAAAAAGSLAAALLILHIFLTAGTTTPTGTLAAVRARQLIPGAVTLFVMAGAIYYGVESLEGHGVEFGLPLVALGALAALSAAALRAIVSIFGGVVAAIVRDFLALLGRCEQPAWHHAFEAPSPHSPISVATRRLGRAPPNGGQLL